MTKVVYVERKYWGFVSIEKVFRCVASALPDRFSSSFVQVAHDSGPLGLVRNLIGFRAPEADVYHITGHVHYMALVLPPKKTILTIHDLGFLRTGRGPRRWLLKKLFLDWPLRRLKHITAISEKTRREIVDETGIDPSRITVIHNPLTIAPAGSRTRGFETSGPVILQVGTLPHKNLRNLIRAVDGFSCRLRIIGKIDDADREMLDRAGIDYSSDFELTDEQMLLEYERADVLSFCSTYEGFGLPVIEAQALGLPVVTSDIEPLRSVAGNGAILVDPSDVDAIGRALRRVAESSELREKLVANGRQNVERFSPESIAELYAGLYDRILAPS